VTATQTSPVGRRDDAILPATRWASWAIVAVLVPAVIVLWGFPAHTADAWAWTFKPRMTAIFMGSGYAAGAYFFARTARGRRWHEASAGVLSAAVFALLMLLPTAIHYDRFNHGDAPVLAAIAFYGWVAVYIAAPAAVAYLWWRNRATDPARAAADEPLVGAMPRAVARAIGAAALIAAAVFLAAPGVAVDTWAWSLTPLTARVLACFTAQVGLGALLLSHDARWGAWRLLLETYLVACAFLLVGSLRVLGDFDPARAGTWLFFCGLIGLALAVAALLLNDRRGAGRAPR
jgi:peptidoglycan/LPS O-acetylase OafA/YrhL